MIYRLLALIVFSFLLFGTVTAQSKKEQIEVLLNTVDSLNAIIESERSIAHLKDRSITLKLDSISANLSALNLELLRVSRDFEKRKLEIENCNTYKKNLEAELSLIKKENSILKYKLDSLTKSNIEIEMVYVEGGTFQMGSTFPSLYLDEYSMVGNCEEPVHSVSLDSYYIGKYEVTQLQWVAVMGGYPSEIEPCSHNKVDLCSNCPVEYVSWSELQEFLRRLNMRTGMNYRLPTEAEWEYAAKGGSKSKGYKFSGSDESISVAWFNENSVSKTHEVGIKSANELGIHDMSGNAWELCSDWLAEYKGGSQHAPKGPGSGEVHVVRGGSCFTSDYLCRSTARCIDDGPDCYINSGFRLVLPTNP
jgi:formylglycine-generating enzyme required for sulfatase activity